MNTGSLFLSGSWRYENYETTETQRHREQKKKRGSGSLKKVKKLWVSDPLWFLEILQLRNHRDAEIQRTKLAATLWHIKI
jgi:hypothetical protein